MNSILNPPSWLSHPAFVFLVQRAVLVLTPFPDIDDSDSWGHSELEMEDKTVSKAINNVICINVLGRLKQRQ